MFAENIAPVILVVGSDSLIGGALINELERVEQRVLGTTRRRRPARSDRLFLDLGQNSESWQLPSRVSVAVICAGVTKIEDCGRDPAATSRINVESVIRLTNKLATSDTFIIYLSTNQVFDGSIPNRLGDDAPSPQTEYGRQKAEVERHLETFAGRVSIVRLTKVLGTNESLLNGWLDALRKGEVIHPFKDMVMSPVPLSFVVTGLGKIIETRLPGIVQISGEMDVTYADVAYHLARRVGVSKELIQPISYVEAGLRLESAPPHTTLDTSRLQDGLGLKPPGVWATIDAAIGM
jgi:dTDP-4-dehydrorhamnose reductase